MFNKRRLKKLKKKINKQIFLKLSPAEGRYDRQNNF